MNSKRKSKIWNLATDQFKILVAKSFSLKEILLAFELPNKQQYVRTLKRRMFEENINYSHIPLGLSANKGRKMMPIFRKDLAEILIKDSKVRGSSSLKERLIKSGLLENICSKCGIKNIWNGEPIVLHMDHINGDPYDNRIDNLRILCPNCHSQTSTYAGRNSKYLVSDTGEKYRKTKSYSKHKCISCNSMCSYDATKCSNCFCKDKTRSKIVWPSIEVLLDRLKTISMSALAKELGVSSTAVKKHIKNENNRSN